MIVVHSILYETLRGRNDMNNFVSISGGETTDRLGRTLIMDNMETLRKRTWRPVRQRLAEPRSRFATLRIPRGFF